MSLEQKIGQASDMSRLNAVDAAYQGSPYGGSNFTAKWQGYDDNGIAIVKYLDQEYSAVNLSAKYTRKNSSVLLRVAAYRRTIMY